MPGLGKQCSALKCLIGKRILPAAFGILILLIFLIGVVGIARINGLSRKIEELGRNNLRLETAVLEMRIKNAHFAMGVRNYVFWRAYKYLGAVSVAGAPEKIFEAAEGFRRELDAYRANAYYASQKRWADELAASFNEILLQGRAIVQSIGESGRMNDTVNGWLMNFENGVYRIDEFLDNPMGRENIAEIERQVLAAGEEKEQAVLFLKLSMFFAVLTGMGIAFSVYRRSIRERGFRQDLFNRMVGIEENERKKLSTAIHDEMGQSLSALKIYLGLLSQELSPAPEEARSKIEECRKIAGELIEKSHNISFLLRPPELDEVGLLESMESLLMEAQHLTGAGYIFHKPDSLPKLPAEYGLLIYRITQELLTNMAKYSQAKNVELGVKSGPGSVELSYRDDGRGFDYSRTERKLLRRREDKFGLGLLGLKERVEALDGSMSIGSAPGKGVSVTVTLPVR